MAKKQTAKAKQPRKETAEKFDQRKAAKPKEVEIIAGVAWMGLPYRVGSTVKITKANKNQIKEMVDAKRAKYI